MLSSPSRRRTLAFAAIKTEVVEYKDGDTALEGFLAYDDAKTKPRPGVLLIHDWMGVGDYAKSRAKQLAELGYVAFAADIYGKGVRPADPKEAERPCRQIQGRPRALPRAAEGGARPTHRQQARRSRTGRGDRLLLRRHRRARTRPQRQRR